MLPGTNRVRDGWARPAPLVGVGVSVFCVELEADSVLLTSSQCDELADSEFCSWML